jgi:hypothetical protein
MNIRVTGEAQATAARDPAVRAECSITILKIRPNLHSKDKSVL